MPSSESILRKSTAGATFLMLAQLFTKAVTFLLNSVLVRFLSPRIFGITAFLEFILGTVLFFSREAIRLSTLRIRDEDGEASEPGEKEEEASPEHMHGNQRTLQTMVNFAHIPLWIGVPLSLVLTTWQYTNINAYFITLPFFQWSIFLIWLSMLVELLSEPFYIVNQFLLNYSVRSRFESIAVTASCLVNFCVIYLFQNRIVTIGDLDTTDTNKEGVAILAFALAKLTHALALLACYYWDYLRNYRPRALFNIRLTRIAVPSDSSSYKRHYYFQADILEHFKKVYFQLCFKHLLTEGDKLIINSMCTVEEQGIYSLLSNYGSLVTRLLFAPIEESLRLFLARLLTTQNSKNLKLSMDVLVNLTKFYLYLSLMIIIFGPVNSSFLLQFLIGSKWSTTSVLDTIRVYCFYLPFLSMNGIFEAFFQSVATGDQILKHSYFMMAFSGIFLVNCWVLIEKLDLSINGLILSNIINMILRIAYCVLFIKNFYRKLYTSESSFFVNFHNFKIVLLAGMSVCLLNWMTIGYVRNFQQLFINISYAAGLLVLILVKERAQIQAVIGRGKLTDTKET